MFFVSRFCALAVFATLSWLPASHAQAPAKPPAQGAAQAPVFKPEEIEQLVAPIALYPDPLVAQILMASTYPLEVVAAARWQKSNPGLKDKQLEDALQQLPWDPSVKTLASFPQVLTMMDQKLDMTQKLGDAFLAQQKDVMAAIQRLRAKADQTGNLKSGKELTVEKKQEGGNTYITIEPTNPQTVYVPTYNPTVVYGTWPYPAYPPYYYYPPGYVPGAAFWGFAAGVAIGAAWGWGSGNCDWHGGDINISNTNTTNINRGQGGDRGQGSRPDRGQGDRGQGGGKWQHNPEHRKGAGYRDQGSQERFGGGQQRPGVDSREAFRGRAEQGRQQIASGGVSDRMAGSGGRGDIGGRPSQQPAGGFGGGDRGGAGSRPSQQLPGGGDRGGYGGGDRGGFGGVGGGGAQTRDFSNRGASSRQNSSFGGGGGGGSRAAAGGGGGGARAGGGGGGGRGGGGGGGRGGGGRR